MAPKTSWIPSKARNPWVWFPAFIDPSMIPAGMAKKTAADETDTDIDEPQDELEEDVAELDDLEDDDEDLDPDDVAGDDIGDDLGDVAVADEAVVGDETDDAADDETAPAAEEDDEEEEDDSDVEASLDVILKERLVQDDDEDEDEDEPNDPEDRTAPEGGKVQPRQPQEFVCQSCFLVKHPSQMADPKRQYCRDCV